MTVNEDLSLLTEWNLYSFTASVPARLLGSYATEGFSAGDTATLVTGIDPCRDLARLKCVGELIERVAQSNATTSVVIHDYFRAQPTIVASDMRYYTAAQLQHLQTHPTMRPYDGGPLRCVWATNPSRTQRVLIPLQFVQSPYRYENDFLTLDSTAGAAFHTDLSSALDTALLELVERDALMQFAMGEAAMSRFDPLSSPVDPWVARTIDQVRGCRSIEVKHFLIDGIYGIPTILCVLLDTEQSVMGYGAACAVATDLAVRKSLVEAIQLLHFSRRAQREPVPRASEFADRVAIEANAQALERLSRVPRAEGRRSSEDNSRRLGTLRDSSWITVITPEEFAEVGYVVKAFVPECRPWTVAEPFLPYAMRRDDDPPPPMPAFLV